MPAMMRCRIGVDTDRWRREYEAQFQRDFGVPGSLLGDPMAYKTATELMIMQAGRFRRGELIRACQEQAQNATRELELSTIPGVVTAEGPTMKFKLDPSLLINAMSPPSTDAAD